MPPIVRRKLLTLTIGEEVDLRPQGIPFSVEHCGQTYRIIPHEPGGRYQRLYCKTSITSLKKLAAALSLPEPEADSRAFDYTK